MLALRLTMPAKKPTIKSLQAENDQLRRDLDYLRAQIASTSATNQTHRNDLSKAHGELDRAREELKAVRANLETSQRQLKEYVHKWNDGQQKLAAQTEAARRSYERYQRLADVECDRCTRMGKFAREAVQILDNEFGVIPVSHD